MNSRIVVVGAGMGGISSALAICKMGQSVVIVDELDRIGGQLTTQAVPLDEHFWMEQFGCSQSYRSLRNGMRDFYRRYYPLSTKARKHSQLNPGAAYVNRVCVEPNVGEAVLKSMIAPYVANGQMTLLMRHRVKAVEMSGDRCSSLSVESLESAQEIEIESDYVIDASETGELLKLARMEYVLGQESQEETGELHANPDGARPEGVQAFTCVYAMDHCEGEDHTIEKPDNYDFWRNYQAPWETGRHLSWSPKPNANYCLFPEPGKFSLWMYRRILYKGNFEPGYLDSDVTLFNTALNDYWLGGIIDVDEAEKAKHIKSAKDLSLSSLYWLQTEAERPDGGQGWPGLRLRKDIVGTEDGLAEPYIRESRRIRAEFTVKEQHIGVEQREGHGAAEKFFDTVGIGCYRMDLHPRVGDQPGMMNYTYPFQIPLGALIPIRVENIIPGGKNIGVTHITNGSFRLHPVEWSIGEAAGALAVFCLKHQVIPKAVRAKDALLYDYQADLERLGAELEWPSVGVGDTYHKWAIQQKSWQWGEVDKMDQVY